MALSSSTSSISMGVVALVPLRLPPPVPWSGVALAWLCSASGAVLLFEPLLLLRFAAGAVDDDGSGVSDI